MKKKISCNTLQWMQHRQNAKLPSLQLTRQSAATTIDGNDTFFELEFAIECRLERLARIRCTNKHSRLFISK